MTETEREAFRASRAAAEWMRWREEERARERARAWILTLWIAAVLACVAAWVR